MAATSSGRPYGHLRNTRKQSTTTTNTHRFVPFSKRIARLKIDPVHRVQRNEVVQDDADGLKTYFGQSLDQWAELNLSENFTLFVQKVKPLSGSLPQILYHADSIFGLLLQYIGAKDAVSSEPLLSLLAHFAHDLGVRFEKYFEAAVKLVLSVAATHDGFEVIEWSFSCLAWILKFLSRLLVSDLRPLLTIMAPYLGRTRQKAYVIRFAAESTAFLVRKAGAMYVKNKSPLENAVSHVFGDLQAVQSKEEQSSYRIGLMSLFSESVRGIDGGLHANSVQILGCLIEHAKQFQDNDNPCLGILEGVMVSVIHESSADGFRPLAKLVTDLCHSMNEQSRAADIAVGGKLLLIISGTRKGSRIDDWNATLGSLVHIAKVAAKLSGPSDSIQQDICTTIGIMLQYSPLDTLLPFTSTLLGLISSGPLSRYFLAFCLLAHQLGRDRFQSLILPHLQQYIAKEWQHNQLGLCLLVHRLSSAGVKFSATSQPGCITSHHSVIEEALQQLCADDGDKTMPDVWKDAFTQLVENFCIPTDSRMLAKYVEPLRLKTLGALRREASLDGPIPGQETARWFKSYVRLAKYTDKLDPRLWEAICTVPAAPLARPTFLSALLEYLQSLDVADAELEYSQTRKMVRHLINNLLCEAREVKMLSMRLMQHIVSQKEVHNLLSIALQILEIPQGLQSVRQITMLIRKLATLQNGVKSDALMRRIILYFCLGLLPASATPVVQELHLAVATMCGDLVDEDIVCDIAFKCLQTADKLSAVHEVSEDAKAPMTVLTRYQCSNIQQIKDLTLETYSLFEEPEQNLGKMFVDARPSSRSRQAPLSRLQALQVFKSIPQAAEKRSRLVVPVFLSMQQAQDNVNLSTESAASTSSHTMSPELVVGEWFFQEHKAFLELLADFTNPKGLFRSQDVFDALLGYLTAGQREIQRLALKAIFTWKLLSVRKYEESLFKLTDEKAYREELTALFHTDPEFSTIQNEDRGELLPVLIRLLYGQMINRSGVKSDHSGQESKRKTILRMLFKMQHNEVDQFLDIAFGKTSIDIGEDGSVQSDSISNDVISIEKQCGLVKTAESMLETLQGQLAAFGERILGPVLYCLYRACRRLDEKKSNGDVSKSDRKISLARNIRRAAIHCLTMMFTFCDGVDWSAYLPSIFQYLITPRLDSLPVETAQGVSGMLQLFATWANDPRKVLYFTLHNRSLLDKLADCLVIPSARDDVKIYVLDQIFLRLVQLTVEKPECKELILSVLHPRIKHMIGVLEQLLKNKENQKVLDSAVALLASLTPLVDSSIEVQALLSVIATLLGEAPQRVSPKVKGNLLQAMKHLLRLCHLDREFIAQARLRKTIAALFNFFKDTENRSINAEILELLSLGDQQASEIASLCSRLNAVSSGKLDAIDYDSRLEAFNAINAKSLEDSSPEIWEPVVQNLIYFARAADDFAIRSNAVTSLRRFILHASKLHQPDLDALLKAIVLQALKKAAKADSEVVRADHVALFGLLVHEYPDWAEISDMRGLLVGDDEDASFFNNILSIQLHRRTRAMRRLVSQAEQGAIRSNNICNFFLPLLEKFIFDSKDDEGAHNLRGQAIVTVGALLRWVEWSQFRGIFTRYKDYMNSRIEAEKDVIKLLGVSADALASCSSAEPANEDIEMPDAPCAKPPTTLAKSLPNAERLSQELTTHFVPNLATFIHQKDESQVTSRIPVAITTVKLLKILPQAQMVQFLPALLLDIAYILRSRSQASRDVARRTLAEVTTIIGPSCIHWILKEARTALSRGYQLHVLSYTIHSILVSNADHLKPGDLDHCLDDLVAVVMDDIFGVVGQEKDAEDYISKMREVKSSKSFDSMELLAKLTTVHHLVKLIRPLQALLTGSISSKQSRQVDELLRRIGVGLSHNPVAASRDTLMFCYEVIQELYKDLSTADKRPMSNDELNRQRFLVQLPNVNQRTSSRGSPSVYKLAKFCLDLVRSILQKHDDMLKPENVHGFLPIVGDALVQAQEDVKVSAIRILSVIIKLPMPELEENAALYVMEAVKVVKDSISTNGEAAQAALKLVAAILRERRSIRIRDSDVSYLLERIMPDLDEPDRQGVSFNLVKAVMARKLMLPEVYDASKKIGIIMITDHGRTARNAARGLFVHFVLEFPQSKDRWDKQIKFLVKNLSYQYPEGRQSVMEAVNMLLSKVGESVADELISNVFIPLVLIIANDDNIECRRLAGALLKRCFEKAGREQLKSLVDSLRSWVIQSENPALRMTGMQAFKILLEESDVKLEKEVSALLSAIYQIVKEGSQPGSGESWEMIYHALQLFFKIAICFPTSAMADRQNLLWSRIRALLTYPHPWVQSSASELIGTWFHDLAIANGKSSLKSLPLVGSHGLQLTSDAQLDVLDSSLRVMKRNWSSKGLSTQTVRNLVFLGRCFNMNDLIMDVTPSVGLSDEEKSVVNDDEEDTRPSVMDDATQKKGRAPAIWYLFTQLSVILRREPRRLTSGSLLPKQSSIRLLAALIQHTPTSTLLPLLSQNILPPLAHLTDPSLATPNFSTDANFSNAYSELVTSASDALALLQKKVGSTEYVKAMAGAQMLMRNKKEQRRIKRKMDRVADPEAAARDKRRRVEKEKRRKAGKREGFRRGRKGL